MKAKTSVRSAWGSADVRGPSRWSEARTPDRAAKKQAAEEAKRILGVPSERLLRTIMSIGYVDDQARAQRQRPAQPRRPLAEIVHSERW